MSSYKQNLKDAQGKYVLEKVDLFSKEMGSIHLPELAMQSREDSGSTGTEPVVNPQLTPTGSGKPDPFRPELDGTESEKLEEQAVLHELACGGELRFLPSWVHDDSLNVPHSWYCNNCNQLLILDREETHFG